MRAALATAAVLATGAAGVLHEEVRHPAGWVKGMRVADSHAAEFTFALKHTAEAKRWLKETVDAVSNPDSARYGKHVSLRELQRQMRVPGAQAEAVLRSLRNAGFEAALLESGDFVKATAPHSTAARYFGTDLCTYQHVTGAEQVIRACELGYTLPEEVAAAVDVVGGLVHFPLWTGPVAMASAPNVANVPSTLRKTYNMEGVTPRSNKSTTAFTQFIGQRYSDAQVEKFIEKYSPEQKGQAIAKKIGDTAQGEGTEALLDAEYLLAMGNGVETWVWTNQNKNKVNNQEPWLEFFTNVSNDATVPNVFSISYGEGEDTLTADYVERCDVELQKIAARGISVFAASGDNGAGCKDRKFVANFPASLPHITSVGGTANCGSGSGVASFSSGGFSNLHGRQPWQDAVVQKYLQSGSVPDRSFFNASGRAYPDVSGCGNVLICEYGVCGIPVSGTSCACPIFSGVVGLLNDVRLAAGKSPLGFAAPAFYKAYASNQATFDDVTSGSTAGCSGQSFSATVGWDPTSGLGTPNFKVLAQELLKY